VPITPDDVVLAVLPQFHVGGWNVQPLLAWWVRRDRTASAQFDAGYVLQQICDRSVTTMMGVPTNYLFLAEHPDFAAADLSSLRRAVVGGRSRTSVSALPAVRHDPWISRLTTGTCLTSGAERGNLAAAGPRPGAGSTGQRRRSRCSARNR